MRWMLVAAVAAMAGCSTRPLTSGGACEVGNPRPISDGFDAATLDSRCWSNTMGNVGVVGGELRVEAGAGYTMAEMATRGMGVGDFSLRARVKVSGLTPASSLSIGWRNGPDSLSFLVPVGSAPATWHALVGGANVDLAQAVPVSSDFAELELSRVGPVVTFLIDGQLVDSRDVADDLSASTVRVTANGAGAVIVDSIELR